jgi:hypothetical protein
MNTKNRITLILDIVNYNLKIVFANKFVYFLIAALAFYLMLIGIMLFSEENFTNENIFDTIIFPGILIIFYPVIFNIQNDKDSRMLEIIFGVPNYRYKVYLIRFVISLVVLFGILLFMSWFAYFSVVQVPIFEMVFELMFPLFFLASTSFLMATLVKNARSASVIMVIIGLLFFIMQDPLEYSKWNIFLNPYNIPSDMSHGIWMNIVFQNKLILVVTAVIALLWSMTNLQKRERFV